MAKASNNAAVKKKRNKFGKNEVMDLINIWSSTKIQRAFKKNKTHANIYKEIAKEYNADTSRVSKTPQELQLKIHNLQASYRRVSLKSGSGTPKWQFFSAMHEIMKSSDTVKTSLLQDSLDDVNENVESQESLDGDSINMSVEQNAFDDSETSDIDDDDQGEPQDTEQNLDEDDIYNDNSQYRDETEEEILLKELQSTNKNQNVRFSKIPPPPRTSKKDKDVYLQSCLQTDQCIQDAIQKFEESDKRSEQREEEVHSKIKEFLNVSTLYYKTLLNKNIANHDVPNYSMHAVNENLDFPVASTSNKNLEILTPTRNAQKKSSFQFKTPSKIYLSHQNLENQKRNNSFETEKDEDILHNLNNNEWENFDSLGENEFLETNCLNNGSNSDKSKNISSYSSENIVSNKPFVKESEILAPKDKYPVPEKIKKPLASIENQMNCKKRYNEVVNSNIKNDSSQCANSKQLLGQQSSCSKKIKTSLEINTVQNALFYTKENENTKENNIEDEKEILENTGENNNNNDGNKNDNSSEHETIIESSWEDLLDESTDSENENTIIEGKSDSKDKDTVEENSQQFQPIRRSVIQIFKRA